MRFAALAMVLLLASCAPPVMGEYPVPPPLPAEQRPLPPVSDAVLTWRPGDWVFAGGSYRYEPGRYVHAAGHGDRWMFGHWSGVRGAYVWVPGHWL